MEPTVHDWGRLAEAITEARIKKGFAKRAAFARELGIDDSTLAIIEGKRHRGRVSDEMLDMVTARLGWPPGQWRAVLNGILTPVQDLEAEDISNLVAEQLDPRLRDFKDHELVEEVRKRMLWAAAKIGGDSIGWATDESGDPEAVSHLVPRAS